MTNRDETPRQGGLFGPLDDGPVDDPGVAACAASDDARQLAALMPAGLRMGTSSWAFPGWRGLVYANDAAPKRLSRDGLAAYGQHPLLQAVGLDRTFYAPIAAIDFANYAAQVPAGFRFLVKAWGELLTPVVRGQNGPNPRYLDADRAIDDVLAPAVEGLGDRLGPLLFQFPPQGKAITRAPAAFADRLHAFLTQLPHGAHYAVELRDEALLSEHYAQALAAVGAHHCFCVHPRMPSIARQRELVPLAGPVAIRWMLHQGFAYQQAKARYEPFAALRDPDPDSRGELAQLCLDALAMHIPVTVVVNNKAEGSAPLSVLELARAIAGSQPGSDSRDRAAAP